MFGYFMLTLNNDSKYAKINLDAGFENIPKLPSAPSSDVKISRKIPSFEDTITSQQNRKPIPIISTGKDSQLTGTSGLAFLIKTVDSIKKNQVEYIIKLQGEIVNR